MKITILLLIFLGSAPNNPTVSFRPSPRIVSSPEAAAVELWRSYEDDRQERPILLELSISAMDTLEADSIFIRWTAGDTTVSTRILEIPQLRFHERRPVE